MTLGNGHNVDVGPGQRGKEFGRDTAQRTHTVAHHRDNRQAFPDRKRLQQLFFQLKVKLFFQRTTGAQAIPCGTQKLMLYSEED